MDDLIRRSLTADEAVQAMRRAVNTWREGRISPAEALAGIGDALQANNRLRAADTPSRVAAAPSRTGI